MVLVCTHTQFCRFELGSENLSSSSSHIWGEVEECVLLWNLFSLNISACHCATQIDVEVTSLCSLTYILSPYIIRPALTLPHFSSKQVHAREHWLALHAI